MRNRLGFMCLALLLCAVSAASAWAASPIELRRLFPQQAEIQTEALGLARLILPTEVLAECRPDLSDLRIFDLQGREVAFLVDGSRPPEQVVESKEQFEGKVIEVEREESVPERGPSHTRERYELEAPLREPEKGHWELVLNSAHKHFVRKVRVRSKESETNLETWLVEAPLFRLDATVENIRLPLPAIAGERLLVEIEGEEGFYLEPRFHFQSLHQFESPARKRVELVAIGVEHADGKSLIALSRPSGLVPDLLEVGSSTGTFKRKLKVWDMQPGSLKNDLGQGTIFRVDTRNGVERLEVAIDPARGATLRVEIDDGDSPPLSDLRFFALVRQPALLFELPAGEDGHGDGTLLFGGGRAHRPDYDLTALLLRREQALMGESARAAARLYDPHQLTIATLGSARKNPDFDPSPALAFTMHPGARIDPGTFSHRKVVEIFPSEEGLSRLVLTPEDTARSEAELADVRIVDEQFRQWPYLIKRDAERIGVPMTAEGPETRNRVTSYRFAPSVSPIRTGRVIFDSAFPFYDRAYTLLARDEAGETRMLSDGRLIKNARKPHPVVIDFRPQDIHEFELRVEDGDDAPLQLGARASAWVPALFLAAPEGRYSLLIGDPASHAPRYEMERVRDVVLAVSSRPAMMGPIEENPALSLRARLKSGDGPSALLKQSIVWGALVLAVIVLGGITLRIVRSEAEKSGE